MNRAEAKQLEQELRRFLAAGGNVEPVLARIESGLATADDPGVVGLLKLCRLLARQMSVDPAELGAEAIDAAVLLESAGELDAAVFAEAVGGALLHRAGDVDAAADIAVRTLAAIERIPPTQEWGSRTAHCLALLFGELHAYELAARTSARALEWDEARTDPMTRLTIETVSGYFAVRAAESHPRDSAKHRQCVELTAGPLRALAELGTPAAQVARDGIEAELAFLAERAPDPDAIEPARRHYGECAAPWVAWHELLHGRALNAAGRHEEGLWTLEFGRLTLDSGLWTLDLRF